MVEVVCPNLTKLLFGQKLNPALLRAQTLAFFSTEYSNQCCQCSFVVEEFGVSARAGKSSQYLVGFRDAPPQPPAPEAELADQLFGELQSPRH